MSRSETRRQQWEGMRSCVTPALRVGLPCFADGNRGVVDLARTEEIAAERLIGRKILGLGLDVCGNVILELGPVEEDTL